MKSSIVASLLLSSLALAAPVEKRAYATSTEIVIETVLVYTTVWDGEVAQATTAPGLFYEAKPTVEKPSSAVTTKIPDAPAPAPPSKTAEAPVTTATSATSTSSSSSSVSTTSIYTPPPAPTTTQAPPKPSTTAPVAPPPPSTTVVPEPEPTKPSAGSGEEHTGSYTMNYYGGNLGACGEPVSDSEMVVALGVDLFGDATVDYMTGKTTNKWCGKKIAITNGGKTVNARIMDRCPGCTGAGLDATPALWEATTGGLGGPSGDRIYSMSWKVIE